MLGAAILAVAAGTGAAQAQPAPAGRAQSTAQGAQAPLVAADFAIPAGPLGDALRRFAAETGLVLAYDPDMTRGLRSPGLAGRARTDEGLQRLLAGTGLTYRRTGPNSATLERLPAATGAVTLDPVTIQGRLGPPATAAIGNLPPEHPGGQVARGGTVGLLGSRDLMDTPFNQSSYTARLIEDQQARSLADVVLNDPSVRPTNPATGHAEQFSIRGFNVGNHDISFGGLFGVAPAYSVSAELAERVEVLKGPNALLSGMAPYGSVGGTINIVPKRAEDHPITRLTTSYISDGLFGVNVDLGRRFGPEQAFGVRVNAFHRDGDTAVDDQSKQEGAVIAGLDYRGERVRLSADLAHQTRRINAPTLPTYFAAGASIPKAPDNKANWFQPWSWTDNQDTFGVVKGEFDLSPDWTLFASAGARESYYQTLIAYPFSTDSSGGFTATPVQYDYKYRTNTQELGVRGRFTTGFVEHAVVATAGRFHEGIDSAFTNPGSGFASSIYQPAVVPRPVTRSLDRRKTSENDLMSLAVADVLSALDGRVQLTLGLRRQQVETDNFSTTTGALTSRYDKSAVTPAVGILVKPWQDVSLYGNYIEGLQRGTVVGPTYANAGQVLAPFVSKQAEVGVKVDWGSVTTTLSAFQITQPSGSAPSPTGVYSADGERRSRGLELNAFGEVMPGVRLLGGLMLIDGEQTRTAGGTYDGNTIPGVPEARIVLGGEWDIPFLQGLTLSGRVIHTRSQYVDNANTQSIPAWTRLDLGARYSIETASVPVTIRFNVENVFDRSYWETSDGYSASPGAPRTFLLSTAFSF
ncbi:ferric-mycobactin receptor FemA [Allostella vacuolata]|nr:ferric-mycobactin receptor FemA [Stella vacuolata]